jgi:hypothetical protein
VPAGGAVGLSGRAGACAGNQSYVVLARQAA